MATISYLQKRLKTLAKSLAGAKGGFGKGWDTASDVTWKEKLEQIQAKLDETRDEINEIINYVDKLVGKSYQRTA